MHNNNELELIRHHMSKSARPVFRSCNTESKGASIGVYISVGVVFAILSAITVASFFMLMPAELLAVM